jgi:hypothetical protein
MCTALRQVENAAELTVKCFRVETRVDHLAYAEDTYQRNIALHVRFLSGHKM